MTHSTGPVASALPMLTGAELAALSPLPDAGLGCLRTSAGNLPLTALTVQARLTGLVGRVRLEQAYVNPHADPVEATYVFPLPDRAAVTGMRMTAADRTVTAQLHERGEARARYDAAIAEGRRASIAEEERPDVFTMRVGNILPGEKVTVELTLVGVLPVEDGEATFRFPLVVAPRYVPGAPLPGDAVGSGHQPDTDAVPDASRISPPVLLPGFPHPVRLDVSVAVDPAGLPMGEPRSSLHAVQLQPGLVTFRPGERADRDIVLRIPLGEGSTPTAALVLVPDPPSERAGDGERPRDGESAGDPDRADGTFDLVVLPPRPTAGHRPRPRDVVLLLDRSGSMAGWKMVAARRAAARIVDTLTDHDRFAVLAFDSVTETPDGAAPALLRATDRHRFRAVEFLARLDARGGTELADPLAAGLRLLATGGAAAGQERGPAPADDSRAPERVLVLVTDGQVGNEDDILRRSTVALDDVRVHTVGIDQAVNAGFLGRLAGWGRGRCELVESEDRLDEAMARIHERIGSPVVLRPAIEATGVTLVEGTFGSGRLPDVFPGVPWVVRGRYRDAVTPRITVRGTTADDEPWTVAVDGRSGGDEAVTAVWARGQLRDLEDRYVASTQGYLGLEPPSDLDALERRIVRTSLRFGVLCRFTGFLAVDERVVTDGTAPRSVVQPVELPAGWEPLSLPFAAQAAGSAAVAPAAVAYQAVRRFARAPFAAPAAAPAPAAASPAAPDATSGPAPGGPPRERATRLPSPKSAFTARGGAAVSGSAPPPVPSEPSGDDTVWLLLEREHARLRETAPRPAAGRRAALADLGSCLRALSAPEGAVIDLWDRLLHLLEPEVVDSRTIESLWAEVLEVLAGLLGSRAETGTAPAQPEPSTASRRSGFWRRPSKEG